MRPDTIQAMPARHECDRAEGAWRHSHELLRYILEHTNSAVAVHDRDLRCIYVSQRYLDAYKVCSQEVIGRHHYEVSPRLPAKWREVHRLALAGQVSRADRGPYCREDGSIEWRGVHRTGGSGADRAGVGGRAGGAAEPDRVPGADPFRKRDLGAFLESAGIRRGPAGGGPRHPRGHHRAAAAEEARSAQLAELRRWQGIMLAHSDRSQALKREENALLACLGQPPRYPSAIDGQPAAGEAPCQPAPGTP